MSLFIYFFISSFVSLNLILFIYFMFFLFFHLLVQHTAYKVVYFLPTRFNRSSFLLLCLTYVPLLGTNVLRDNMQWWSLPSAHWSFGYNFLSSLIVSVLLFLTLRSRCSLCTTLAFSCLKSGVWCFVISCLVYKSCWSGQCHANITHTKELLMLTRSSWINHRA